MPRYCLTVHWPALRSNPQDDSRLHVYIQHRFKDYVSTIEPGDRVLFYESGSGPPKLVNGKWEKRRSGRQAVVCDARVARELELRPDYEPEEFNGRVMDFRWQALTDPNDRRDLFVPRALVNERLGYETSYTFQGFNAGRGILLLQPEQYAALAGGATP